MNIKNAHNHPTRRDVLKQGTFAIGALAAGLPSQLTPNWFLDRDQSSPADTSVLRDPAVQALLAQAITIAQTAGATYADVRATYSRRRGYGRPPSEGITLGISVRALVNGYWGWAATPIVSPNEVSRIAHEAVALARTLASNGRSREVDLGSISIPKGDWKTPISIDPFDIAIEEVIDWGMGLQDYIVRRGTSRGGDPLMRGFTAQSTSFRTHFEKQDRAFASTEGADIVQTTYETIAHLGFRYKDVTTVVPVFGRVKAGWEYIYDQPIRDTIAKIMDEIDHRVTLPIDPIDVGRYDVVFHNEAVSSLLGSTLGEATQLDRALGYEANTAGTSYLGPDPYKYLGTPVASPLVNVTANRSVPRGIATTAWDDEGVTPSEFTLVKDGALVDYQATREHAAHLAPWYQQQGTKPGSKGVSQSPSALHLQMQHTPNLVLVPGTAEQDFESLIASLDDGLAIKYASVQMDQQVLNGIAWCNEVFRIKKGKKVSRSGKLGRSDSTILFRSPEFWKNVIGIGGKDSALSSGNGMLQYGISRKGDPSRMTAYSLNTVPIVVKQLALIDPTRRAS